MNKILSLGALALGLVCASEQQASAWVNFKFGVGLNLECQSGNNNFLWGAFRNGPTPGDHHSQGVFPHGIYHSHGGHGGMPYYAEAPTFSAPAPAPVPAAAPLPSGPAAPAAATSYYYPGYSNPYHYTSHGYYSMPTYYYPATWYGQ